MTADELYAVSMNLLNEDTKRVKDYPRQKIAFVNLLLSECMEMENWLREEKGTEKLSAPQKIKFGNEEIEYDENYTRECMPYALAAMFAVNYDREAANVYSRTFNELTDKYRRAYFTKLSEGADDEV